ncbi:MAG: ribonuclease HI family protein [Anaerolineae bacterium]
MAGWDWQIVFDGGSRGNPGLGYGSYRLRPRDGEWSAPTRLDFGGRVTNNEAEYKALLAALTDLGRRVPRPETVRVEVIGDSKLVLSQMRGDWRIRAANLRQLANLGMALAARFQGVTYRWQPRAESVRLLGH